MNILSICQKLDALGLYSESDTLTRLAQMRSNNSVQNYMGYDALRSRDTAQYNNLHTQYMQKIFNEAKTNPQLAGWLKQHPEYLRALNPENTAYFGGGANEALFNRVENPNDDLDTQLNKDLNLYNSDEWQVNNSERQNQIPNINNYEQQNFNSMLTAPSNNNMLYVQYNGQMIPDNGANNLQKYKLVNNRWQPV